MVLYWFGKKYIAVRITKTWHTNTYGRTFINLYPIIRIKGDLLIRLNYILYTNNAFIYNSGFRGI